MNGVKCKKRQASKAANQQDIIGGSDKENPKSVNTKQAKTSVKLEAHGANMALVKIVTSLKLIS